MQWDGPVFKRAYEVSTSSFLGETIVYDPSSAHNLMFWNESRERGRRVILANGFPLVDSGSCADEGTLAKLEAYREQRRNADRAKQEALRDDPVHANTSQDSSNEGESDPGLHSGR
jgi:hypothetical protein